MQAAILGIHFDFVLQMYFLKDLFALGLSSFDEINIGVLKWPRL